MTADEGCRIYAVLEAGPRAAEHLDAALEMGSVAAALIVPPSGAVLERSSVERLIARAQSAGVAALIRDDVSLVQMLGADGVHVSAQTGIAAAHAAAREGLGASAIIGVDPGISRHDAMSAAEDGADYIAFGAPRQLGNRDKGRARRNALVAWWAEIFEVPCVAFDVESAPEAHELKRAGADFVAVAVGEDEPATTRRLLGEIASVLRDGGVKG